MMYGNDPIEGVNLLIPVDVYTPGQRGYLAELSPFALGQVAKGTDNSQWLYCLVGGGGITGASYACIISEDFGAVMLSNDTGSFEGKIGVAGCAATAGQYAWIQVYGVADIQVAADCAANVALSTTATPGVLDDDDTLPLSWPIGIVLTAAAGGDQEAAPGLLNWSEVTGEQVPDSYHADAVHFDGATWLGILSLACTDSGKFSFCGWFKSDWEPPEVTPYAFVSDPDDAYTPFLGDAGPKIGFGTAASSSITNAIAGIDDDAWHSLIFTEEKIGGDPPVVKLYIDGIDSGVTLSQNNATTTAMNGKPFYVGSDTFDDNYIGDVADLRIMPNVSLLTAGDISAETLALFIADGKPVDPAVATDALGIPCMLFSGDATGFAINQGNGGTFTLTGALTNASTSPSD